MDMNAWERESNTDGESIDVLVLAIEFIAHDTRWTGARGAYI